MKTRISVLVGLLAISAHGVGIVTVNVPHSEDGAIATAYGTHAGGDFLISAAISSGSASLDLSGLTGTINMAVQAGYDAGAVDFSQYWWGNSLDEFTSVSAGFTDFSVNVLTGTLLGSGRGIDPVTDTVSISFFSPGLTTLELTDAFADIYEPSRNTAAELAGGVWNDYLTVPGKAVWNTSVSGLEAAGLTVTELDRVNDFVEFRIDGVFVGHFSGFAPDSDIRQLAMDVAEYSDALFNDPSYLVDLTGGMADFVFPLNADFEPDPLVPYYLQGAVFNEDGANLSQVYDSGLALASPGYYIPEPGTLLLLALGFALLLRRKR